MKLPPIETHNGRRALAFLAIWGGCITYTVFAAVGLWLVRDSKAFSFWLALAAHGQVLVGMTALGWALGRRAKIEITRDGASLDDGLIRDGDDVTIQKEPEE